MSHTRPQKKVLATLRGLLRHVHAHFDNQTGTVLRKDVSPWTKEIMARYRAAQNVKNREEVRNLRAFASDLLAELQAVHEQKVMLYQGSFELAGAQLPCLGAWQELFFRYGGISAESGEYRHAAANRVGVTIPEKIPLREFDKSKYFRQ
jgi:hypothetical protein